MPLDVIYTKSRSIWDDINPFLEKLGQAYVKSQQTKWDNEWQLSAISDIEKANKPQEINSFLEMQNIPKENIDLDEFKGFATEAMSMLAQKEMVMSPEDFQVEPGTPATGTGTPQTKIMPDKMEWSTLYKFVSELPTGKVDWTDTLNVFKKKLESGRAIGSAGQQFLQMIMGQSMPVDQRQKVQKDFEFTKDIKETLYPETFDEEAFYEEHPEMELKGATSTGHKTYGKKAEPKDELKIDVMKFLEEHQDEWEFGSINSKGDFTIRRKDTTKKYDFETWKEAQEWTKANPQAGFVWKIDPQPEGFNVTAVKKTATPTGGTTKLKPTFNIINDVRDALYLNPDNRDSILNNFGIKYDMEGVDLPSIADVAKWTYSGAEAEITNPENEYIDEKGVVKDEYAYRDFYADYEKYAFQYFKETGEILPKKFLSLEEAGKYESKQWKPGKWEGGQKPIFNTENIPWSWQGDIDPTQAIYEQIQRENISRTKEGKEPLTLNDIDLEGLAKKGVDIERLKKIFGWGM